MVKHNGDKQNDHIPNNSVVAVIGGDAAADAAERDLKQHGFTHTRLFHGDEVTASMDPKGRALRIVGSVVKAVQDHLTEELNYLAQYQEEARNGNVVLAVQVDNLDKAEAVKSILEEHGAHNLRFFGTWAVHDLTPETNPSAPSEASAESKNWSKT